MFRRIIIGILFSPIALLYGLVISFINFSYDIGLLKASKFNVPVIGVGNLSIGGAGKTPHIEYLIDILQPYIQVATLSRGYKRATKGFRLVQFSDTALTVGDEPMQYRHKYRDLVVAVSENRAYAIPQILQHHPDIQAILLDDSFQHRGVKPGLNILLTAHDALFTDDYLLPSGRLREWRSAYQRADIIIVSKCPDQFSAEEKTDILNKINPYKYQKVFFTYYEYGHPYNFYHPEQKIYLDDELDVVLLSAIANTSYLYSGLESKVHSISEVEYEDHHYFDRHDIEKIQKVYSNFESSRKIILTTEKDAMRLALHRHTLQSLGISIFVLPAKVKFHFDEGHDFDTCVKQFLLNFTI
jgi:tetraacyldisaccharide 4'-kinase